MYWAEFRGQTKYEVYFEGKGLKALFGTKKGERTVGGIVITKAGGALVLLPMVDWNSPSLTFVRGKSTYWRKEAVALSKRFIECLISAAEAFRKGGNRTPPPAWVLSQDFSLAGETSIIEEISKCNSKIEELAKNRQELQHKAEEVASLRGLLYETGKPLERAILKALRILGFTAETYSDGESEFDAVFTSPEGRFLGEVEGKDNRAINIDKMTQLERNLQEDFSREGVTEYAKGVLFGNAFRLAEPQQRTQFFTEKCQKAAKRLSVALVRSPDLFAHVRYLSQNSDPEYARSCRQAIFNTSGEIVVFPSIPGEIETGSA
jgi:hypothetical protein